ncbi:ATP-binding mismatch repair protein [Perkinsus olseni]|uniref:ATP-binding mismatch repair protein n=1 Tax=Perkinsus olseni TaxID=32597 RepID=A0A7J6MGP8_PEROL|nr:ATP-binding mismatch repair protein [Perkinsus olseni]
MLQQYPSRQHGTPARRPLARSPETAVETLVSDLAYELLLASLGCTRITVLTNGGTLTITGAPSQPMAADRVMRLPVLAYLPRLCSRFTLTLALWNNDLTGYKLILNDPTNHSGSDLYTVEELGTAMVPSEARLACTLSGVYLEALGRCTDRIQWAIRRLALAWPSVYFAVSSGGSCDPHLPDERAERLSIPALRDSCADIGGYRLLNRLKNVWKDSASGAGLRAHMLQELDALTHWKGDSKLPHCERRPAELILVEGVFGGVSKPLHHDQALQMVFIDGKPVERGVIHEFVSSLYLECGKALQCPQCTEYQPRGGGRRRQRPNRYPVYVLILRSRDGQRRPTEQSHTRPHSNLADTLRRIGSTFVCAVPDDITLNLLDRLVFRRGVVDRWISELVDEIRPAHAAVSRQKLLSSSQSAKGPVGPSQPRVINVATSDARSVNAGRYNQTASERGEQAANDSGDYRKIPTPIRIRNRRSQATAVASAQSHRGTTKAVGRSAEKRKGTDRKAVAVGVKRAKSIVDEVMAVTKAVTNSKRWEAGSSSGPADEANASTVASTTDLEVEPRNVQSTAIRGRRAISTELDRSRGILADRNSAKEVPRAMKRNRNSAMSGTARKIMRSCEGRLKDSVEIHRSGLSFVGKSMAKVTRKSLPSFSHATLNFNRSMFKGLTNVRQVDRKFIIGRFAGVLLAIDQHAAGERVGLEGLVNSGSMLETQAIDGTSLLLKPMDASLLQERRATLEQHGWRFTILGGRAVVTGVPKMRAGCLTASPCHLLPWATQLPFPAQLHYMSTTTACRQAVKFGDLMSSTEVSALVSSLGDCELPFQCAHGRPTVYPICTIPHCKDSPFPDPLLSMLVIDPLLL